MSKNAYITEAFKQFNSLVEEDEELVTKEEMPIYDVDSERMHDFLDVVGDDSDIDIIDLEAEAEEDLKQSYVGKVILDCNVCHSNIFINREDVVVDEDGNANIELECPYCMSNEGYTIIGQVEPYSKEEEEPEEEIEDETEIEEPIEEPEEEIETEEEEEIVEESLNRKPRRKISEAEEKWVKLNTIPKYKNVADNFEFNQQAKVRNSKTNRVLKPSSSMGGVDDYKFTVKTKDGKNKSVAQGVLQQEIDDRFIFSKLGESIEDVTVTTEDETMTMTTKEDGGVVIETAPVDGVVEDSVEEEIIEEPEEEFEAGEEIIAPISDEEEAEIELNSEVDALGDEDIDALEEPEEMPEEEEPEEIDIEEFDEESFDELGESYLREHYDNVTGFKTVNAKVFQNSLIVEGVIRFESGNSRGTQFVFEAVKSKGNSVLFEGFNKQISRGKKTFKLNCALVEGCIKPKKMSYNYITKNELNESVRVNGTVKVK